MSLSFVSIHDVRAITCLSTEEIKPVTGEGVVYRKTIEIHTADGQVRIVLNGNQPQDLRILGVVP